MANVSSSNSQEANVPKLRFPEFEGEWKTVVLSDFTERVTRKNVNNESNLPLTISSKDGLVDQISYFNKPVASRDMSGYYLLQNGEFAYNKSYSVGYDFGSIKRLDIYPKGALSTLYICFALKKYDSDFIKIYFDSLKWYREICMIAAEGARNHGLLNVSADAFFATKHILPQNEKEQEKIATFMVLLEKRVVLQQQLVDALKSYKRGALSQLFPKNGASVPEYRFSGFTGDWEQRKLGEICQVTMGQSPDGSTYSEEPSDYILVQGNADLKDGWVSPRVWTTQKTKTAQAGDLIMSVRAPAGAMGKTAYDVVLGRGVAGIKGNEFVYQLLVKIDSDGYWKKMAAGSTFESVNSDVVNNAEITIPKDMEEQEKIGAYFIRLDTLITLHQKKVEQYINLKQFMLEKLFI